MVFVKVPSVYLYCMSGLGVDGVCRVGIGVGVRDVGLRVNGVYRVGIGVGTMGVEYRGGRGRGQGRGGSSPTGPLKMEFIDRTPVGTR